MEKDLMVRSESASIQNISFLYQAYKPKFWYAEVSVDMCVSADIE